MKSESESTVEAYLKEIGVSEPVMQRINELVSDVVGFLREELVELFVSNRSMDGIVSFDHLWIFTDNYASEIRGFMKSSNFDVVSLKREYFHVDVKIERGRISDIENAGNVVFEASTKPVLVWRFEANGINARYAKGLLEKYVVQNISY